MSATQSQSNSGPAAQAAQAGPPAGEPVVVSRRPVFDREGRVFALGLSFWREPESDADLSRTIADGFALAVRTQPRDRRVLIDFPAELLLRGAAFSLPKDVCIVGISEPVYPTSELLPACMRLKEAGYTLAAAGLTGKPGSEPLLSLADMVRVNARGLTTGELIGFTQRVRPFGRKLLAEQVEDTETLLLLRSLGYSYFQGGYFDRPQIVPGRPLGAGEVSRLKLLGELGRAELDHDALELIIGSDIALTYRLMQFVNSAGFGLGRGVDSVAKALTLAGNRALRQWLMVVLVSDMAATPRTEEVALASARRARFLELAAGAAPDPEAPPETLFLFGLFSKLDVLLGQPMREIVDRLPLTDALLRPLAGELTPLSDWLILLEEEADAFPAAKAVMERRGLSLEVCARCHAEASLWAWNMLSARPQDG